MADCDDPRCPGWLVNAETFQIERCDNCRQFESDEDAAKHVQKIWDRELEFKYQDYPKFIRLDGRKNMILCTVCGKYEELFVGQVGDALSGIFNFVNHHMNWCGGSPIPILLTDEEWLELTNALETKISCVENGDYDGEASDIDPWLVTLRNTYNKITETLHRRGIPY